MELVHFQPLKKDNLSIKDETTSPTQRVLYSEVPLYICLLLILLFVFISDAPMVFISTAADTDPQQTVLVFLEETATVGTYFCSADGYPEPDITWMFNGGELPEGVSQVRN